MFSPIHPLGIKSPRGAAPEAFENRCDIEFRVEKILV
jgi:hypothetical protein